MTVAASFWSGKRVLVTGHTGFKGAWLSLWLSSLGADVHGFALPPQTAPNLFTLARVSDRITSTLADLRDVPALCSVIAKAEPEIVFHLAAQPLVIESIADPIGTMETNILGTANLLQALRGQSSVSTILVITSDKVYANDDSGAAFREDAVLGGKDPYSASKAAAELVVRAFRATYFAQAGVRAATARGGNVIGGGDYAQDRLVPDVIRAVLAGTAPVLRMPNATRPWQHVLDCLAGYLTYAQALSSQADIPVSLNFGPSVQDEVTASEVATTVMAAFGLDGSFDVKPVPQSVEMKKLSVNTTLARKTLGWADQLVGRAAIAWTADWYKRVRDGEDPRLVTLNQIELFQR